MNGRKPTAKEKEWMAKARQIGCICCFLDGHIGLYEVDSEHTAIHHIDGQTKPEAHFKSIPLCYEHHQGGSHRIHGYKRRFEARYGTELELLERVRDIVKNRD